MIRMPGIPLPWQLLIVVSVIVGFVVVLAILDRARHRDGPCGQRR